MKLSRATLSAYAGYTEDAFFGFSVEMYSESARKRRVNPKKFYLIDPGLHNYLTLRFAENRGRLLENLVFLELRRKGLPIFYYRTARGGEVDFLIKDKDQWNLIGCFKPGASRPVSTATIKELTCFCLFPPMAENSSRPLYGLSLTQVCHDLTRIDAFSREKKALLSALSELRITTGTIINETVKRMEQSGSYSLNILPIWEWLLSLRR